MKKVMVVGVFSAFLAGCAGMSSTTPPANVALIPNDCANTHYIIPWLESQLNSPASVFQSKSQKKESQRAIKHRIWSIRYHCDLIDDGM